jgi:hypothetical protein
MMREIFRISFLTFLLKIYSDFIKYLILANWFIFPNFVAKSIIYIGLVE